MSTTYGFSAYSEIWDSLLSDLDNDDRLSTVVLDRVKLWILEACQKITQKLPISRERELLLVKDQEDYRFADSTEPATGTGTVGVADLAITGVTATGTGTISTDNEATDEGLKVTGVGTLFKTELAVGKAIIVGTEVKEVLSIESNLICYIDEAFDDSLSADAFTYSTTLFTRELVEGSTVIINSETKIIDTITDPYNAVVTTPFAADAAAQTFTVDTVVTEIPTDFEKIYKIDREESGERIPVQVWSMEDLLKRRQSDGLLAAYSNLAIPFCAAMWTDGTGRFLRVYPAPDNHKQVTIYAWLKIKPKNHLADLFTANIPLSSDYDQLVKEYVKWKTYDGPLKDRKTGLECRISFQHMIDEEIASLPATRRIQVEYD